MKLGSLLYFSIVETSLLNFMYQTSLEQFLVLFENSLENTEKSLNLHKRV